MTYVRPIVEHESLVWSPYTLKDIDALLEQINDDDDDVRAPVQMS